MSTQDTDTSSQAEDQTEDQPENPNSLDELDAAIKEEGKRREPPTETEGRGGFSTMDDLDAAPQKAPEEQPGATSTMDDLDAAPQKATEEQPGATSTMDDLDAERQKAPEDQGSGGASTMDDLDAAPQKATEEQSGGSSTMDDLDAEKQKAPEELSGAASTMDDLDAEKQKATSSDDSGISTMDVLNVTGRRTPLTSRPDPNASPPQSMLEGLLNISSKDPNQADKKTRARKRPGDPSTRAPRMALLPEPEERVSASTLENVFSAQDGPMELGSPERPRLSSLSQASEPVLGPPMRLRRKDASDRLNGSSDLSLLLGEQRLPRAQMPERTLVGANAEPDGFTPIRPERLEVNCILSEHQKLPGGLAPVATGERIHHRLDFRYNRFERLKIRQLLYEYPEAPQGGQFAGANPAFFASHAPLGNGMLARLVVAMYRDGLPLSRMEAMLTQLGNATKPTRVPS